MSTIALSEEVKKRLRRLGGKTYESNILILFAKAGIIKEEKPKEMWVSASEHRIPLELKFEEEKPKFKIADDGTIIKL